MCANVEHELTLRLCDSFLFIPSTRPGIDWMDEKEGKVPPLPLSSVGVRASLFTCGVLEGLAKSCLEHGGVCRNGGAFRK